MRIRLSEKSDGLMSAWTRKDEAIGDAKRMEKSIKKNGHVMVKTANFAGPHDRKKKGYAVLWQSDQDYLG